MSVQLTAERLRLDRRAPPPPSGAEGAPGEEREASAADRDDGPIRCAACGATITDAGARAEIGGAHEHEFMNPGGFAFRIGCFAAAPGCIGAGEESTYWSWFPGHAWRIALCGACRAHLGWSFRSEAGTFHGLIVDRLVS